MLYIQVKLAIKTSYPSIIEVAAGLFEVLMDSAPAGIENETENRNSPRGLNQYLVRSYLHYLLTLGTSQYQSLNQD